MGERRLGVRRIGALVALCLIASSSVAARAGTADTSGTPLLDSEPLCAVQPPGPGTTPTRTHATRNSGELHVTTYNMLHGQGERANLLGDRIPLVVDTLLNADADAIGLQEVVGLFDAATNTAGGPNAQHVSAQLAQGLADAYGEPWEWCWFGSNPQFPGEPDLQEGGGGGPLSGAMTDLNPTAPGMREGLAVLSRFDITASRTRRLLRGRAFEAPFCDPVDAAANPLGCPAESVFDHRQILWARITTPDSQSFDLFTTHLAHHLTEVSQATKRAQLELALLTIDEWADGASPTFFVGDFNSTEDGQGELDRYGRIVEAGFVDTYRAANPVDPGLTSDVEVFRTSPTQGPSLAERIDFVWLRADASCAVAVPASEVIGMAPIAYTHLDLGPGYLWPSDHFGVASTTRC